MITVPCIPSIFRDIRHLFRYKYLTTNFIFFIRLFAFFTNSFFFDFFIDIIKNICYNEIVMKICNENGNILIYEVKDFKLTDVFECGQCFRFNPDRKGGYIGTAHNKTVRISQEGDTVVLHSTSYKDFLENWYAFFDFDTDYGKIKKELTSEDDPIMINAIRYGGGIRILNQDLWETLVSFIISASNNIPRIKKIIELLCSNFGAPHTYEGKTYYSFPDADTIANLSEEELGVIRAGYRADYILSCAKAVSSGEFCLDRLCGMTYSEAKKELLMLRGVGNKVADCVLLFALHKLDSFPIDVWIKRITEYCYFDNISQKASAISDFAARRFGNLGGIAQQYLFYYARSLKIGT